MSGQQELICGLSRVVTIAVLPRLDMEELIFELNRRIQNLDKENSIKDRLVSILKDVMLEEYRQLERKLGVGSPDEMTIPEQDQETATMHEQVDSDTMSTKTPSSGASLQSSGLDIVIKKETSEVLMHTNELDLDTDQVQLTQQQQLYNIPSSATLPSNDNPLKRINRSEDSRKDEDFDMTAVDEAARACHNEISMDTPTFYNQVLHTINPTSDSCTEKPFGGRKSYEETPSTSRGQTQDHSDVRRWVCHVSNSDQAGQICKASNLNHPERYSDDRDTGFMIINSGHEQNGNKKSEETSLAPCQPTPDQACDIVASLLPGNDSPIDPKRYMCGKCGYRAYDKHRLLEHMRKHTGEKPFMCDQCGYRASYRSGLYEHMKKHTGVQPFSCDICKYKTYRKSDMEKHRMYHTGVKPHKCEDCDYSTAHKPALKRHMRRHTGERPYSCRECDYRAKEMSNLVKHMMSQHQISMNTKTVSVANDK
ncbi:zinc finger protein 260-like isoform X2 [Branchiostoma lanceolatum]